MTTELTKTESQRLKQLERSIESTKGAFVACGKALAEIRDSKLYRAEFPTFEEYCEKKHGWTRARAYQIMESSEIVSVLSNKKGQMSTVVDISERAARELKDVPEKERAEVVKRAQKSGAVTSASIKKAAGEVVEPKKELDKIGRVIPPEILADWNRAQETGTHLRSLASEIKLTVERGLADRDVIFSELVNVSISEAVQLQYTLSQVVPYAVCPSCQGLLRSKCQMCKKRGFVSKWYFNSPMVTEETRKMLLKK